MVLERLRHTPHGGRLQHVTPCPPKRWTTEPRWQLLHHAVLRVELREFDVFTTFQMAIKHWHGSNSRAIFEASQSTASCLVNHPLIDEAEFTGQWKQSMPVPEGGSVPMPTAHSGHSLSHSIKIECSHISTSFLHVQIPHTYARKSNVDGYDWPSIPR
jgi:hypothetical protein